MIQLLYPTTTPYITQAFGVDWKHYKNGHPGVDFRIKNDLKRLILAAQSGRVVEVYNEVDCNWYTDGNWSKGSPYGIHIIIEHQIDGIKYWTLYGHLRYAMVKKGDEVAVGQEIAVGGNSGLSTGPHLHFELRKDKNSSSHVVNPTPYFCRELKKDSIVDEVPDWASDGVDFVKTNNLFDIMTEDDIRDAVKFYRLYNLILKKIK